MKDRMMDRQIDSSLDFLASAFSSGSCISTEAILDWINQKNRDTTYALEQVPLSKLADWEYKEDRIKHKSGKFFSIPGIRVSTNYGLVSQWDQPIINQPEIGFLGFLVQKKNGILHFLLQAKVEPGNINVVQLSPTLQATRSNYMRVHHGRSPEYLEYFTGKKKVEILVDQLQSEQGARFYQKRNRNIIVEVDEEEDVPLLGSFVWATLGQIKQLMRYPNVVNMDTRTVISCITYGNYSERDVRLLSTLSTSGIERRQDSFLYSVLSEDNHLYDIPKIIRWITSLKFKYDLNVEKIGLSEVKDWSYDGEVIAHKELKFFSVIGVNVTIAGREVTRWGQPMVKAEQEGLIGFLVKKINGIYHFLVQAKVEPGVFDVLELAPTVQCLTGNYRKGFNEYTIPYIEYFVDSKPENIWYSVYQSEEGGRFYKEQNLNMIVEVGDEFPIEVKEDYMWMTLNQLMSFVTYNNYLNIAARSLLSAVSFID